MSFEADSNVFSVLKQPFPGSEVKLVPPLPAEAADERILQKLIGAYSESAAEGLGRLADFPAMKVHGGETVVFLKTHRV